MSDGGGGLQELDALLSMLSDTTRESIRITFMYMCSSKYGQKWLLLFLCLLYIWLYFNAMLDNTYKQML